MNIKNTFLYCYLLLLLLVLAGCSGEKVFYSNNPPIISRSTDEQKIAWVEQIPSKGLALGKSEANKVRLSINGVPDGAEYDYISDIVFSPDGSRTAFAASKEGQAVVILDGEITGPPCEEINPATITFSPDNSRLGYAGFYDGSWHLIIDGEAFTLEGYTFVDLLLFSPDAERIAYRVHDGSMQGAVVDGVPGPFYQRTENFAFSPDSSRFAYSAADGESEFIVADGTPLEMWDEAGAPVFSDDSLHLAYSARKDGMSFVLKDERIVGERYPMDSLIDPVIFGPGDPRIAFTAYTGKGWAAVIDGVRGPELRDIIQDSVVLSPDGTGFLYTAADGGGWFIVKDGIPGPAWQRILVGSSPYSAGGKHFVYAGQENSGWRIVLDGRVSTVLNYDELKTAGGPNISADGRYIVYTARKGDDWHIVLNNYEGPGYSRVYIPMFTDKGIEYLAETGSAEWLLHCFLAYPENPQGGDAAPETIETKLSALPQIPFSEEECVPCKVERRQQTLKELLDENTK